MKKLIPVLAVVAAIAVGGAALMYKDVTTLKQNPNQAATNEVTTLVAKVAKIIILPEGETPTVATITDVSKVKNQPFFAEAKNGDKLLIYQKANEVLLYSVTLNKILAIAPLNIGGAAPAPAATDTSTTKTDTTKKK